jgi:hypothetical protein
MIDWADTVEGWLVLAAGLPVVSMQWQTHLFFWPWVATCGFALSATLKRRKN